MPVLWGGTGQLMALLRCWGGRGHISINKAVPVVCLLHQVCLCGVFLWSACIKLGEIPGSGEALAERKQWGNQVPLKLGMLELRSHSDLL